MNRPSDEIIDKVLNGLASKDDAKYVAEWFRTDAGQEYLSQKLDVDFLSIKEGYEDLSVGHDIPSDKMYDAVLSYIRKKRNKRIVFRVAAVLLPFVLIATLFYQLNSRVDLLGNSEYQEIYVPKGERVQFVFQDGTRAYINSDSRIYYPTQFGLFNRTIRLEGEAYFIVTPNKKRPFVVEVEKGEVQVLGTSFNVEAYPQHNHVYVALDEGKINLVPWTKKERLLHPGEKMIYDKTTGECTIVKDENIQNVSLWRKDVITFSDTPLSEVIERLNRWYNVEFVVEDKKALDYTYTFTSENTLLENVLRDMEKIAPVRFIYKDKKVEIRVN